MQQEKVRSIETLKEPVLAHFDTPIDELVRMFIRDPGARNLCVLDKDNVLIGIVDRSRLFRAIYSHKLHPATRISELYQLATAANAQEIMLRHIVTAKSDDFIEDAIKKMVAHDLFEIPVIDSEGHLIGILDSIYFLESWIEKQPKSQ